MTPDLSAYALAGEIGYSVDKISWTAKDRSCAMQRVHVITDQDYFVICTIMHQTVCQCCNMLRLECGAHFGRCCLPRQMPRRRCSSSSELVMNRYNEKHISSHSAHLAAMQVNQPESRLKDHNRHSRSLNLCVTRIHHASAICRVQSVAVIGTLQTGCEHDWR